ncbi:hypothetical protein ACH5RR_023261 [Cinchona calisaya]|uniref:Endonuclease/exonuclease/phosphatase domain-containing protein n=1 Tax=Cinchona calisaya TaxID=153742 RepID=A0ABD2ZA59_9GENT
MENAEQYIHFTLTHDHCNQVFEASFVYAKYTRHEQRLLWECLRSISANHSLPWIIGGDFNVIESLSEYFGISAQNLNAISNFCTVIWQHLFMDAVVHHLNRASSTWLCHQTLCGWFRSVGRIQSKVLALRAFA